MSDFFPAPPATPPEPEDEANSPEWLNPPNDTLPGVVAYELIIGQSATAAVVLTGMRAFPNGVSMRLSAHTRKRHRHRHLNAEVLDGPYRHDRDDAWHPAPRYRRYHPDHPYTLTAGTAVVGDDPGERLRLHLRDNHDQLR